MSIVSCPTCATSLGELGPRGRLVALCAGCGYRYEILRGTIVDDPSRRRALRSQAAGWDRDDREYHLRLQLAPGEVEAHTLWLRPREDRFVGGAGDEVVIAHTMRGDERYELLYVANVTTGERFYFATPGSRAEGRAAAGAVVVAIVLMFVLSVRLPPHASVLIAGAVSIPVYWLFSRTYAPRQRLTESTRAELRANQSLLDRKRELEIHRKRIELDDRRKLALQARLSALQAKMRGVGIAAYERRIAALDRALAVLAEQLAVNRRLIDAYDRSIAIIEIEHESGTLAEAMDDDVALELTGKLEELRALESSHAELSRQLEANAEVEQLLRGT